MGFENEDNLFGATPMDALNDMLTPKGKEIIDRQRMENITIGGLMRTIEENNDKWWRDLHTGEPVDRNVGEMLCLVHSEISEALEGHRKNLMDDHLQHRKMFVVELADAIIRILDIAAHIAPDLPEAIVEKIEYNKTRRDHSVDARKEANGKKY